MKATGAFCSQPKATDKGCFSYEERYRPEVTPSKTFALSLASKPRGQASHYGQRIINKAFYSCTCPAMVEEDCTPRYQDSGTFSTVHIDGQRDK